MLLVLLLLWTWRHTVRAKLIEGDTTPEVVAAICRRIIIAQSRYAFGAALCIVNTYWSIAGLFLLQLDSAIAPRMRIARWWNKGR